MSRSTWAVLVACIPGALLVLVISGCNQVLGVKPTVLAQCSTGDGLNAYQCECTCPDFTNTGTYPMLATGDDAEELISNGAVLLNGQVLDLGESTSGAPGIGPQVVGLRFPAVGIPQGSTILSASIQFTVSQTSSVTSSFAISGVGAGDVAPFVATSFDVSALPTTAAQVAWPNVPAWSTINDATPAQLTPDLTSIVQEIVTRGDWASGHALAFTIRETLAGSHRMAKAWDGDALRSPVLRVRYQGPSLVQFPLTVCMPDSLNPNKHGSFDADSLAADCSGRVGTTVGAMASACGYTDLCTCAVTPGSTTSSCGCNDDCPDVLLDLNPATLCDNFNPSSDPPVVTATHTSGTDIVCTAHSPVAAAMFGLRSQCDVTGPATLVVGGNSPDDTPTASGVVNFVGRPCTTGSCAIGMEHVLKLTDVTFSSWWSSTTLTDIQEVGGSLGLAGSVDSGGAGTFLPDTTLNTGRGRRDTDTRTLVASNDGSIAIGVDRSGKTCTVDGAFIGSVDPSAMQCENAGPKAGIACTSDADCATDPQTDAVCSDGVCNCLPVPQQDMNLAVALSGTLENQPPVANGGPDQTVECNVTGGARVVLDGTGSTDADGNIAMVRWFLGSRAGPLVGFAPKSVVTQALGNPVSYVLRVIDGYGQSDEDTTVAKVVDTTPPVVTCNAPDTITPPKAPVSYTATAVDICDPNVIPTLSGASCYTFNKTGKKVLRTDCVVTLKGPTITISDSGGVDDFVAWNAQATDASGNLSGVVPCLLHIVKPP